MTDLAAALAALRAGDKGAAWVALIRAWRERRSPALAAFVDALGDSPFVAGARVAETVEPFWPRASEKCSRIGRWLAGAKVAQPVARRDR